MCALMCIIRVTCQLLRDKYLHKGVYTCMLSAKVLALNDTFRFHCCLIVNFYRAALNAGWSSHETAVCPSVCLSVKRVDCDKIEECSTQIFIPYEKSFILNVRRRMVGDSDPFYLKFLVKLTPLERKPRF